MSELQATLTELFGNIVDLSHMQRGRLVEVQRGNYIRRAVTHTLIVKQFENTEAELVESLSPVFKSQIKDIIKRFLEIKEIKSAAEDAHVLASLIFDPQMWTEDIVNATLPVLALNMARAGVGIIPTFGVDVRKSAIFNRKQTTATEWLEKHPDEYDELLGTFEGTAIGTAANIRFMSEIPAWMKRAIMEELAISFSQDYWRDISITTQGDAEKILEKGLLKGWSIRRMAREMESSLGGTAYARKRATKIAITESGNALNGVRVASIDQLTSELGPVIPMKKAWISVLGDTTRDSHADLDGVPEDDEGLWNLDGVRVPWPAHYTLPPENRCNCLCSVITELGMGDDEARRLIGEHEQRVAGEDTENV